MTSYPIDATEHLSQCPTLHHGDLHTESCQVCKMKLVPECPKAIVTLKWRFNWWSNTWVGAISSLIAVSAKCCCNQGRRVEFLVRRYGQQESWPQQISCLPPTIQKVVILELANTHYTMTVFERLEDVVLVKLIDGVTRQVNTPIDHQGRNETNDAFLKISDWANLSIPTRTVDLNYMNDKNLSSCGPIFVLALYHELKGEHFTGVDLAKGYQHCHREGLVDWYVNEIRILDRKNLLKYEII